MIGAVVKLRGTDLQGIVVGCLTYLGDQTKYAVRYCDNSGPQERWFQASEISFDVENDNVLALRRAA